VKKLNGVDDSQQLPISGLVRMHTDEGGALKNWMILLGALVPVALAVLWFTGYVDTKAAAAVSVHAEHPHAGVVDEARYERDLDRIENKVDKVDAKLDVLISRGK
jgi:hypothetical protein